MKIKEVEAFLGVPRASIRFYEKQKLLVPSRRENKYRDYAPEDVAQLQRVIILRKIGIPVSEIKDILDGTRAFQKALAQNTTRLQEQTRKLTGALRLCTQMEQDKITIDSFYAPHYWAEIAGLERRGFTFLNVRREWLNYEQECILADTPVPKRSTIVQGIAALLCICVLSGLDGYFSWGNSFWSNFLQGAKACGGFAAILLPGLLLRRKYPHLLVYYINFLYLLAVLSISAAVLLILSVLLHLWR